MNRPIRHAHDILGKKNQHSYTLDMSQTLVTMATSIKELYVTPTLASLLKLKQKVPCIVR